MVVKSISETRLGEPAVGCILPKFSSSPFEDGHHTGEFWHLSLRLVGSHSICRLRSKRHECRSQHQLECKVRQMKMHPLGKKANCQEIGYCKSAGAPHDSGARSRLPALGPLRPANPLPRESVTGNSPVSSRRANYSLYLCYSGRPSGNI
jgi:hypothetical protein